MPLNLMADNTKILLSNGSNKTEETEWFASCLTAIVGKEDRHQSQSLRERQQPTTAAAAAGAALQFSTSFFQIQPEQATLNQFTVRRSTTNFHFAFCTCIGSSCLDITQGMQSPGKKDRRPSVIAKEHTRQA